MSIQDTKKTNDAMELNQGKTPQVNEWGRFGLRLGLSAALHPFVYAKMLMQIGYEPVPPKPGFSIFGKPIMMLPNVFQYVGHIRKINGFYGCYCGLTPRIAGGLVSMLFSEELADRCGLSMVDMVYKEGSEISDEELFAQFKGNLQRDLFISTTGILIAQPFHVISVRMMAQFVGRETIYSSLFGAMKEIYRCEGILGFFAGLVPKLTGELACVVLTSGTVFLFNKYVIKDRLARQYNAGVVQFVFSTLLYPLQVVSTCMTITGARLRAGRSPIMPEYATWMDCLSDLQARGELRRGSVMFGRSWATDSRAMPRRIDNDQSANNYQVRPKTTKLK